jgi:hypothetical protein
MRRGAIVPLAFRAMSPRYPSHVTAREELHEIVRDLPEEDCEPFGEFLEAVKEGRSESDLRQVYASLSQSTHDSVQSTLARLRLDPSN